jgi:hypothetical protein
MQEGYFWADFWLVVQWAPALINVMALIATLVIVLAAVVSGRR